MSARIISLDQFRGYTVLGMFVVNFLGSFAVTPPLLKHHDTYCSYADTIMPQFFFAVGFAYRLTFLRRAAGGEGGVYGRFWRRNAKLILLGAFLYLVPPGLDELRRAGSSSVWTSLTQALGVELFQTLVHIGVTALWILPVIGAKPLVRVVWAGGSALSHVVLSHWFYYEWVNTAGGIDGGPLGFLTWTLPMIAGSLAHDILIQQEAPARAWRPLLAWGVAAMVLGYGLSCLNRVTPPNLPQAGLASWLIEPPFVPPTQPVNLWNMNQRAGTVSYLTFGTGFSLAVYALFVWACEGRRWQLGLLRTLGTNALAAYVIHIVVGWAFHPMISSRASPPTVLLLLVLFLTVCCLSVRLLERKGIYWRM